MTQIGLWLFLAFAGVSAMFFGVNHLIDRGRQIERAAQAESTAAAKTAAIEHYKEAETAIDAVRAAQQSAAAAQAGELERLRDERAKDEDAGGVVFDDRWADWLRGKSGQRPAGS